jgi:hypothetical protein
VQEKEEEEGPDIISPLSGRRDPEERAGAGEDLVNEEENWGRGLGSNQPQPLPFLSFRAHRMEGVKGIGEIIGGGVCEGRVGGEDDDGDIPLGVHWGVM